MSQSTKVERPHKKTVPVVSPRAELEDAVTWLSEHLGFPAPSRKVYESRTDRPRR